MSNNDFTGLNNTNQQSAYHERMNLVATHMYSQYVDYQQSKSLMYELFNTIYQHIENTTDYFRQNYSARGIQTDDIYAYRDDSKGSLVMSLLWRKIGFTVITNDMPRYLYHENRGSSSLMNCARILATNGDCVRIINENPNDYVLKLVSSEIASLYIPPTKEEMCEIKLHHLIDKVYKVYYQDAAREFFLKVVESFCGGGISHQESSLKLQQK